MDLISHSHPHLLKDVDRYLLDNEEKDKWLPRQTNADKESPDGDRSIPQIEDITDREGRVLGISVNLTCGYRTALEIFTLFSCCSPLRI